MISAFGVFVPFVHLAPYAIDQHVAPPTAALVIGVIGYSIPVARVWQTPLGFLFIDGGHAEDVAMADYAHWSPRVMAGGTLAIHDVFEDPADGGQAPFHVWERAVADGFEPTSATGSLRVLRRG